MIPADATLSIQVLPLSQILVWECQERYINRCLHYVQLLKDHPGAYAGVVAVSPSREHPGLYDLLDGHHRFVASILAGRTDLLALVIAERPEDDCTAPPHRNQHTDAL